MYTWYQCKSIFAASILSTRLFRSPSCSGRKKGAARAPSIAAAAAHREWQTTLNSYSAAAETTTQSLQCTTERERGRKYRSFERSKKDWNRTIRRLLIYFCANSGRLHPEFAKWTDRTKLWSAARLRLLWFLFIEAYSSSEAHERQEKEEMKEAGQKWVL